MLKNKEEFRLHAVEAHRLALKEEIEVQIERAGMR